jgi:hypothetical protein
MNCPNERGGPRCDLNSALLNSKAADQFAHAIKQRDGCEKMPDETREVIQLGLEAGSRIIKRVG